MIENEELLKRRLEAIMAHEDGRAWMWDHLSTCGVFTSSYVNNSLDMSFNEGMRNVGLKLLADLQNYTFKAYQMMEAEARERNEEEVDDELLEQ